MGVHTDYNSEYDTVNCSYLGTISVAWPSQIIFNAHVGKPFGRVSSIGMMFSEIYSGSISDSNVEENWFD